MGQTPIEQFTKLFQGSDDRTAAAAHDISAQLPKKEAELMLSRLPVGKAVHLDVPKLPAVTFLSPGDDPKVVRAADLPVRSLERVLLHDRPHFLPAYFLELGVRRQRAVARIRLKMPHMTDEGTLPPGSGWGTGFLISDSLLMTNNHVIQDRAFARDKAVAQFNFQVSLDGTPLAVEEYDLDPQGFFYTSAQLDYTIVRVKSKSAMASGPGGPTIPPVVPGTAWGHLTLTSNVQFAVTQYVNIIQHPAGTYKEVVLQENEITEILPDAVRYKADTEPGSSGSPVFDNQWTLLALHHSAGRQENNQWLSNEGIRIDRIIDDVQQNAASIVGELGLSGD